MPYFRALRLEGFLGLAIPKGQYMGFARALRSKGSHGNNLVEVLVVRQDDVGESQATGVFLHLLVFEARIQIINL